ncbi:MAG: TolC family protein [Bacteroidales bacterium]|nr:TolC family protein [Bacteroidales bacterium]
MNWRKILLLPGLILLLQGASAQKTVEMNLQQCLEAALQNDLRVKLSTMDQEKLKYQVRQTAGTGLPQVSASGSFQNFLKLPTQLIPGEFFGEPGKLIPVQFGTNYNMSGGIQVSQLIYNQSFMVSLGIAKRLLEQGNLEIEKSRQSTVYDIAQLYYMAVLTHQQIQYMAETLEKLDSLTFLTKIQLDRQLIRQVDFDRVNVNRNNLVTETSNLKLMLSQQLNMLKYFTGYSPTDSLMLTTTVFESSLKPYSPADSENHLSLREIDQQKLLLGLQMDLVHSQSMPYLAAFGDFSYNNQQNKFKPLFSDKNGWLGTSVVGLSLNVPLYNGGQRYNQIKQYKVQYKELELGRDYTKRMIETDTRNAMLKVQSLQQTAESQQKNVVLAEDVYKVMFDQYSQGYASLTDLLSAESAKISARGSYAQALAQLRIAELDLLKSKGMLLDLIK